MKRDKMQKPDFLSDTDWAHLKDQTSSLDRIRSDGKADVATRCVEANRLEVLFGN